MFNPEHLSPAFIKASAAITLDVGEDYAIKELAAMLRFAKEQLVAIGDPATIAAFILEPSSLIHTRASGHFWGTLKYPIRRSKTFGRTVT